MIFLGFCGSLSVTGLYKCIGSGTIIRTAFIGVDMNFLGGKCVIVGLGFEVFNVQAMHSVTDHCLLLVDRDVEFAVSSPAPYLSICHHILPS